VGGRWGFGKGGREGEEECCMGFLSSLEETFPVKEREREKGREGGRDQMK